MPRRHPLRSIRTIVNATLEALSGDCERLYGRIGRPSIPPEKLLRALLLQAFYSIRSERPLMERLDFDPLFRWFVGLGIDDPVWDHSTFSKNRERLLGGDVAARFLAAVLNRPKVRRPLSAEHFSVDGTLVGRRSGATTEFAPGSPPTGVDEELPATARRWRRWRCRLPWPKAQERQPRFDQRPTARAMARRAGSPTSATS